MLERSLDADITSSKCKQMQLLTLEKWSYCKKKVRLLSPLPLCLFSCLLSPGVMQTPFHRQNILCRSCQSVYPQAWVSIWGLTSNIENWPAAPTAFPSKRSRREWERASEGRWGATWKRGGRGGEGRVVWFGQNKLVGQEGSEREGEEEDRSLQEYVEPGGMRRKEWVGLNS